MFPFNKPVKKNIPVANINLNLGVSPPRNKKQKSISPLKLYEYRKINTTQPPPFRERSYSISISPPKSRETNMPFTSHNLRASINKFYKHLPSNKPTKLNLMKKLGTFTNNLKNTLFTKNKPVFPDLGQSSSSSSKNIRNSIGGKITTRNSIGGKITTKKSTKNSIGGKNSTKKIN